MGYPIFFFKTSVIFFIFGILKDIFYLRSSTRSIKNPGFLGSLKIKIWDLLGSGTHKKNTDALSRFVYCQEKRYRNPDKSEF